ncbi:hypothetical protein [Agathobacter rectalis]|jgi:hypothetical protein|uniref:Uncharacterized protein n=1 Tax=Agathobacter rectalis TaxID=39491 RepID=A0A0M6WGV4_9FIRM|nr:hypothetical protein [Agathobacter rectalis]CRL35730.1 hypothetical protein T1815_11761 [Agathobacter rectalis]
MQRKNVIDEKLESFARINKIAEYALDKAVELGLTQQEAEEIPEQIKQILKWERCRDNIEYKRPLYPDDTRARCLKVLL